MMMLWITELTKYSKDIVLYVEKAHGSTKIKTKKGNSVSFCSKY